MLFKEGMGYIEFLAEAFHHISILKGELMWDAIKDKVGIWVGWNKAEYF